MSESTVYTLPWPPSVNGYWASIVQGWKQAFAARNPKLLRARQIMSARGRKFRADAVDAIQDQGVRRYDDRVFVLLNLHPPTRRKYDVDNYLKATLDALTHAGVLADDELVYDLRVVKCDMVKGGRVNVLIESEAA